MPRSPVAWQKRWKVPRACTCWTWSLRKGGSKVTLGRLSGPEPEASQGLLGEEDESGPRQDREEDPGGGKGIGDEAARQRTEKRKGTEAKVIRNTLHAEKRNKLRKRKGPGAVLAPSLDCARRRQETWLHPSHQARGWEEALWPQQSTCSQQGYKLHVYSVIFQMYTIQSRKIKTK